MSYDHLKRELARVLRDVGMDAARADLCARLFADANRDGVASHGLDRFPRFVAMVKRGLVRLDAAPVRTTAHFAVERWDGRLGPGNLNAHASMARAIELAGRFGVGVIGLANTNHWMRGGNVGWQAADAGMLGICWTNTLPNLPPWGASDPRVGNNPLVIAVPRPAGHVVVDMAMSQFSYGALAGYSRRGAELPVPGGYDTEGRLTADAAAIERSGRPLPIGFWKGSALALVLDMAAALLSGGQSTYEIPADPDAESGLSQVFIAIDPSALGTPEERGARMDAIIEHLRGATGDVRYPGQRTLHTRRTSLAEGVEVDADTWRLVRAM